MATGENNKLDIIIKAAAGIAFFLLLRSLVRSVRKYKVKNKVIVITGGSRGLGLLMTRRLYRKGAKVVICARDREELNKAAEEFSDKQRFQSIQCDVTKEEDVERLKKEVFSKFDNVDVLINNAGIIQTGPVETMKKEDYAQAMNVHFWGPLNMITAFLPGMKKRKKGRIVNISSIGGKVSVPHLLPYSASKFALSGLSEGLTSELHKDGIKVTTIYPGLMRTGSPRNVQVKGQHEKEYAWFKIADSLPGISKNADKSAKKIINAMRLGKKTLTITFPAKLATAVNNIAPGLNISVMEITNNLLPSGKGAGNRMKRGYESKSRASESAITALTDDSAERNNEL